MFTVLSRLVLCFSLEVSNKLKQIINCKFDYHVLLLPLPMMMFLLRRDVAKCQALYVKEAFEEQGMGTILTQREITRFSLQIKIDKKRKIHTFV